MDPLFPELPEDLSGLSDEELDKLEADHREIAALISAEDEDLLKDRDAAAVLAEFKTGVEQVEAIVAYRKAAAEEVENYQKDKAELEAKLAELTAPAEETEETVEEGAEEIVAADEPAPEPEPEPDDDNGDEEEAVVEERELVLAAAETDTASNAPAVEVKLRRPPAPSAAREPKEEPKTGTALVAAGEMGLQFKEPLNPDTLAELVVKSAAHHGPHPKIDPEGKYRFGGPEHKIARADFSFPDEWTLSDDVDDNAKKIKAVIVDDVPGGMGGYSLTASGGICAPSEPIYSMPNFATEAEPVWDSLPVFRGSTRRRERPDADVHRGHHDRDLLHLGGERRARRHVRNEVVSGPRVPRVHGDVGEDLRALPRVREPERQGMAREDRPRERPHDGGSLAGRRRGSCSTGSRRSPSTSPTAPRRSVP